MATTAVETPLEAVAPSPSPSEVSQAEEANQENEPLVIAFTLKLPSGKQVNGQCAYHDQVHELRPYLYEDPEASLLTSYKFVFEGQVLNEPLAFSAYPFALAPQKNVITVELAEYNAQTALVHVTSLVEILNRKPAAHRTESPSVYSLLTNEKIEFSGFNEDEEIELTAFLPSVDVPAPPLKSITQSGWNPPPYPRQLAGDLFYLDIKSREGSSFCVTASPAGFYVNSTKQGGKFNPEPFSEQYKSHSLAELLGIVSPQFKTTFAHLLQVAHNTTSLDFSYQAINPAPLWLAHPVEHKYNPTRAEGALRQAAVVQTLVGTREREWLIDLRITKNLSVATIADRVKRCRQLHNFHTEFVAACQQGAMNIVEGKISPLNPTEPKEGWMFSHNNIFFTATTDVMNLHSESGGSKFLYSNASNEIVGLKLLNFVDSTEVYPTCSVVVDYMGHRLLCQSLVPGLFNDLLIEGKAPVMKYGGPVEGKAVDQHEDFVPAVKNVMEQLFSKESVVVDKEGVSSTIYSPTDTKGIFGCDGHKYLIDYSHFSPRDLNYPESKYAGYILRPELVRSVINAKLERNYVDKTVVAAKKILEEFPKLKAQYATLIDPTEAASEGEKEGDEEDSSLSQEEEKAKEQLEQLLAEAGDPTKYSYNLNVGMETSVLKLGGTEEQKKADIAEVQELATYLSSIAVPTLIRDLIRGSAEVLNSEMLKEVMHYRGVNMRYLGKIALAMGQVIEQVEDVNEKGKYAQSVLDLILNEMVIRVSKHLLRALLIPAHHSLRSSIVITFLNSIFGQVHSGKVAKPGLSYTGPAADPSKLASPITGASFLLGHDEIWSMIRSEIQEKYNFTFPQVVPTSFFSTPTLRAVCVRNGIQLALKEYSFSKSRVFNNADLIRMFCTTKHSEISAPDGDQLTSLGQEYLGQGRLDVALEYYTDALQVYQNVYGPMHASVERTLSSVAHLTHRTGDPASAYTLAEKCVVVAERVYGLDSDKTASAYAYLAQLGMELEERPATLAKYLRRALYITKMTSTVASQNLVSLYINLANVSLDSPTHFALAQKYNEKAIEIALQVADPKSLLAAHAYHSMALTLYVHLQFRAAVEYEMKNYEILKEKHGSNHTATQQSNVFLKRLTTVAVSQAKSEVLRRRQRGTIAGGNLNGATDVANLMKHLPQSLLMDARKSQKRLEKESLAAAALKEGMVTTGHLPVAEGTAWTITDGQSSDSETEVAAVNNNNNNNAAKRGAGKGKGKGKGKNRRGRK